MACPLPCYTPRRNWSSAWPPKPDKVAAPAPGAPTKKPLSLTAAFFRSGMGLPLCRGFSHGARQMRHSARILQSQTPGQLIRTHRTTRSLPCLPLMGSDRGQPRQQGLRLRTTAGGISSVGCGGHGAIPEKKPACSACGAGLEQAAILGFSLDPFKYLATISGILCAHPPPCPMHPAGQPPSRGSSP